MHIHIYTHLHTWHTRTQSYTHTHTYTLTRMHIHIHTHMHTYSDMNVALEMNSVGSARSFSSSPCRLRIAARCCRNSEVRALPWSVSAVRNQGRDIHPSEQRGNTRHHSDIARFCHSIQQSNEQQQQQRTDGSTTTRTTTVAVLLLWLSQ